MDVNLPLGRRDVIAARLGKGQAVVAASLADEFSVSEDAIRRDLRALAAEGRCRRVYGGALPLSAASEPMAARIREAAPSKLRLAEAAVATIQPGELVFLDSGSTNLALVDLLPEDADLTLVTNAVNIAGAALRRQDLRVIVIGGMAEPMVGGCVDAAAVETVSRMRFDRAFLGACAASPAQGIGAFHYTDATFKRAVAAAARCTLVLATTDKLSLEAPFGVMPLRQLEALVIAQSATAEQRAALEGAGCRLIVVKGD